MKELHGTANVVVPVPLDRCFALLATVDRYPAWYPQVVKAVDVIDRDAAGIPSKIRTLLRVARQPLAREFDITLAVAVDWPRSVDLTLVGDDPERFAFAWRLAAAAGTEIRLDMNAKLDVPHLLPLGSVGDSLAADFLAAAVRALG